jgi:hypothetical protein
MARKRRKRKCRSCSTCKPHKTGRSNRWTSRELLALRRFEKTLRSGSDWDAQ